MINTPNQNPEQCARDQIDQQLQVVQASKAIDFSAGIASALLERIRVEKAEQSKAAG